MDQLSLINVVFDADDLPMSFGDLQLLPGFTLCSTESQLGVSVTCLVAVCLSSRLQLSPAGVIQAKGLVKQMEDELSSRSSGFEVMVTSAFLQLVTLLSRPYCKSRSP